MILLQWCFVAGSNCNQFYLNSSVLSVKAILYSLYRIYYRCWWQVVNDNWMLVTLCWWHLLDVSDRERGCWWRKWPKPSPTSQSCRQHISSPTLATNIDVAKKQLWWKRTYWIQKIISANRIERIMVWADRRLILFSSFLLHPFRWPSVHNFGIWML